MLSMVGSASYLIMRPAVTYLCPTGNTTYAAADTRVSLPDNGLSPIKASPLLSSSAVGDQVNLRFYCSLPEYPGI